MMEKRSSLSGHTVFVPESPQLMALRAVLEEGGAQVGVFNETTSSSHRSIERWLCELLDSEFDYVIFTTAQSVHLLSEFADHMGRSDQLRSALSGVTAFAAGRKTAQALGELGVVGCVKTVERGSAAMVSAIRALPLREAVVGLAKPGKEYEAALLDVLSDSNADVRLIADGTAHDEAATKLFETLRQGRSRTSIVVTSTSQVSWLLSAARTSGCERQLSKWLGKSRVVAAEAAAEAVRRLGVQPYVTSTRSLVVAPTLSELEGALRVETPSTPRGAEEIPLREAHYSVVVVGNGMVCHRLCEELISKDPERKLSIAVFGEEPRPAYNRVQLTSFLAGKTVDDLLMAPRSWYSEQGIELMLGERVTKIDRENKTVLSSSGQSVRYEHLVLATGSEPFVPSVPGIDLHGVFLYRRIEDLEAIAGYAKHARRVAVLGGGLLGLEAAKAVADLGLETHVVECASRLMPRQLDEAGSALLMRSVNKLGIFVHLDRATARVVGEEQVSGIRFQDGQRLEVDMVVVSAGIRARDELARDCGLRVGERGGIVVNDEMLAGDPNISAVGECALHRGAIYGLVAPGYEMARVVAERLTGQDSTFSGGDLSAKLKLLGVDVASFGYPFASGRTIVYEDLVKGIYKKLVVSHDRSRLLGGVLVGDASDYASLLDVMRSESPLPKDPEALILGERGGLEFGAALSDGAQVCSCNNISKGDLCKAIRAKSLATVDAVKTCTKAGTGCGGCLPMVGDILTAEMKAAGKTVKNRLCEHFELSRQELYEIIKVQEFSSFEQVIAHSGRGHGCEVCKPAIASILASVLNGHPGDLETLQDTNDRYFANIQRQGTYSVVPRVPGGEITPEQLIVLGQVAKRYGLYTKITGGQRVDLFGARLDQLPDIWEELIQVGFESGHAYGKALRTVKSCVGSTWCRYGVQDSIGFAVRLENRYKGIRAPHKLKSAASGCVRECAEAQSKDFGVIATEKGWNVYVCGNGGAKPRHADLLASDCDEETVVRYLDRFIMFYIATADRLTRTSVWLEKLEGGIDHLREVIVEDKLGIAEKLEADMAKLIASYRCEWTEVVEDPAKRARFKQFVNSAEDDASLEWVPERQHKRPSDWVASPNSTRRLRSAPMHWVKVARAQEFPDNGGRAFKYGKAQIAVFNFAAAGRWYATQNKCPHMQDMVLARGIIGDQSGIPKVACPMHKKAFSLETGKCLDDDKYCVETFAVEVREGWVHVKLPEQAVADQLLGPERLVRRATPLGDTPVAAE